MSKLLNLLRTEPAAAYVTGLGAVAALVIAFAHMTGTEAGWVSAAATALGAILTGLLARPVSVAAVPGAVGVLLQALVLFNVHMSSAEIAAVVTGVNLVLGFVVMRPQLTSTAELTAQAARRSRLSTQLLG